VKKHESIGVQEYFTGISKGAMGMHPRRDQISVLLLLVTISLAIIPAPNAVALQAVFSGPTMVAIGEHGRSEQFPISVNISNPQGVSDSTTGVKDLKIFFNRTDITRIFLQHMYVVSGGYDSTDLEIAFDMPQGILAEGLYFLSVGLRDFQDVIYPTTMILKVGSPVVHEVAAGSAISLRDTIANRSARFIHIPAGHYNLTDSTIVAPRESQVIFGDGPGATIISGASLTVPDLSPILVMESAVVISSLRVENTLKGSGIGLDGGAATRCLLHNLETKNNPGGGGVAIYNSASATVLALRSSRNGYDGLTVGNGATATVAISFSESNELDGFGAEQGARLTIGFSESLLNKGVGIGFFSGGSGIATGSLVNNNMRAGMFIGEGSVAEASNCRISNNGEEGIGILGLGSQAPSITNNYITGNTSGVTANGGSIISSLSDNYIAYNKNSNISVLAGSAVATAGNVLRGSTIGIGVDGDQSYLHSSGDDVAEANDLGMLVQDRGRAELENTKLNYNQGGGIAVVSGSIADLSMVELRGNSGFGLGINDGTSLARVSASTITENHNYGIVVFESHGAVLELDSASLVYNNQPADIGRF